jgi:hypothetical protein
MNQHKKEDVNHVYGLYSDIIISDKPPVEPLYFGNTEHLTSVFTVFQTSFKHNSTHSYRFQTLLKLHEKHLSMFIKVSIYSTLKCSDDVI